MLRYARQPTAEEEDTLETPVRWIQQTTTLGKGCVEGCRLKRGDDDKSTVGFNRPQNGSSTITVSFSPVLHPHRLLGGLFPSPVLFVVQPVGKALCIFFRSNWFFSISSNFQCSKDVDRKEGGLLKNRLYSIFIRKTMRAANYPRKWLICARHTY